MSILTHPFLNLAAGFSRHHARAWVATRGRLVTSGVGFLSEDNTPSMRALREPYPSIPPDSSLFEDGAQPTQSGLTSARFSEGLAIQHGEAIVKLIEAQQFSNAYSLRQEFLDTGHVIHPHPYFLVAAVDALKTCATTKPFDPSLMGVFLDWLDLVPDSSSSGTIEPAQLSFMLGNVLMHPHQISFIARFAISVSKKGFAAKIAHPILSHIARYSYPSFSQTFFYEFEQAHLRFYGSEASMPVTNDWHALVIQSLCLAGRLPDAVEALQNSLRRNINLPSFTFTLLLEELYRAGDFAHLKIVQDLSPHPIPSIQPSQSFISSSKHIANLHLPDDLRSIRKRIVSNDPPSATHLADFMLSYTFTDRSRAIYMLRKKIRRHGSLSRWGLWATAEMIYHTIRKDPIAVLLVFTRTFQSIGIPEDIINRATSEYESSRRLIRSHRRTNTSDKTITISPINNLRRKLWPSTHNLAIVWQALVQYELRRTHRPADLERLYDSLLNEVATIRQSPSEKIDKEYSLPPVMFPDAAYFNPFIIGLGRRVGTHRAIQILRDMGQWEIPISLHNWTALAGLYAREGNHNTALEILESLEQDSTPDLSELESHTRRHKLRSRTGPVSPSSLPSPNLVSYTDIMRGYIRSGRLGEAMMMKEKILKAGYVEGSNRSTEAVFRALQQSEMNRDHPPAF